MIKEDDRIPKNKQTKLLRKNEFKKKLMMIAKALRENYLSYCSCEISSLKASKKSVMKLNLENNFSLFNSTKLI